jgi:hypothetical protein
MLAGKSASARARQPLRPLAWEEISEPGTYVEVSTGNLYRITEESLAIRRSFANPGESGPVVVQLSTDPFILELAARIACARHNIPSNF